MGSRKSGILAGTALVLLGVLVLIHNLWPWWINSTFLWGVALVVVSAGLFVTYKQQRQMGFLIVAWGMLGLGGTFFLKAYGEPLAQAASSLFLLGWAVGFFAVHLRQPRAVWPPTVGGIFFVMAVLIALNELGLLQPYQRRFIFFFGMALVFTYTYLGLEAQRPRWAGALAVVSLALAVLSLLRRQIPNVADFALPALLILLGVWLVVQGLQKGHRSRLRNTNTENLETPKDESAPA